MIIAKISGGLGNQLFQYAAARNIAELHKTDLKLNISSYRRRDRFYQLKYFNIIEEIATDEEIENIKKINIREQRIYHYEPDLINVPSNTYLIGMWQSEKFFQDIKPIIRREVTLKKEPDSANQKMANRILNCEAVMLHVRRGDYVPKVGVKKKLETCPLEYYHHAAKILKSKLKAPHFFIFSDDWEWVQKHLKINSPVTFVNLNKEKKSYQDLYLMSLCKYFIISNSTFSWWGAWLSTFKDKIVFYPKIWFQPGSLNKYGLTRNTRDLIPDSWKRGYNSF